MNYENPNFTEVDGDILPVLTEPQSFDEGPWDSDGKYQGYIPPEFELSDTQLRVISMADKAAKDSAKRDAELEAAYKKMWEEESASEDNRDPWKYRELPPARTARIGRAATKRLTSNQQNANERKSIARAHSQRWGR